MSESSCQKKSTFWNATSLNATNLQIGLLIALTATVFSPTLGFDFVNWDDPWYVLNNDLIKSWHPVNLWGIGVDFVARNYAPVTISSFLIDHTLWGLWAGGYHLTNVLLHCVNVALVYLLVRQVTKNQLAAFTTAALFGIHPVQIETVAWVSSRKGILSAMFILGSLIYYLRPERSANEEGKGLLLFFIALFCKAIAVVVPVVVMAYDIIVRKVKPVEALARQAVPCLMAGLLILATASAQTTIVGGVRGHIGMSKLQLFFVDATLLWQYVWMLIAPTNLSVLYDPATSGIPGLMALSVAGCGLIAWILYSIRNSHSKIVFGLCASFLFLVPVLNLFPLTTLMNDRYLYLPCIGVFAVATVCFQWILEQLIAGAKRAKIRRVIQCASMLMVIGIYSVMTSQHLPVWKNGHSLWSHAIQKVPQITVVQIQWANTLQKEGQTEQAIAVLEHAMKNCSPDGPDRERMQESISEWSGNVL